MGTPTVTDADLSGALAAFRRGATHATLDTGRYRMRYFVWGAGPPLVFLHGMADAARAFVMVMHRLLDRHTCIAYELPNGQTDGSALARYLLRDYVDDLIGLLDHLGLRQVVVLGSSFGSTITIAALAAAPHRFTRSVLQNGFARRPLTGAQRRLSQAARYWPGYFGTWPAIYEAIMSRVERPTLALLPPAVTSFFHEKHGRTPIRASALRTLAIGRTDLRPLLPTIRTPVLLIGGDLDPLVPREIERELEAGLRDVRRVELAPCGHYPQYTHPGAMAEAIRAFLDEHAGDPVAP
jgi:pimeloyl-ACP methyl ester carboxylesterase